MRSILCLFTLCLVGSCWKNVVGVCLTDDKCTKEDKLLGTRCQLDPKSADVNLCCNVDPARPAPGNPNVCIWKESGTPDLRPEDAGQSSAAVGLGIDAALVRDGGPVDTAVAVECMADAQCTADPDRPLCVSNACVGCAKASSSACAMKSADTPVCGPSGACVQCTDAAAHCKAPGKGFCSANRCGGCQDAGPLACKEPTGLCNVPTGVCVECIADAQCGGDPNRSFCVANACVGCAKAAATACAMKSPATAVCAATGACVACNASADCAVDPARPICDSNKCRSCSNDGECALKVGVGPGICMTHQDGRCASEAETIYVQAQGCAAGAPGTAAAPLCTPQDAVGSLTATRRLVIVRGAVPGFSWAPNGGQVSVVGQSSAVIANGTLPAIHLKGGDVYARGLSITGGVGINAVGVLADGGATFRADGLSVTNNAGGGIILDGARFEIRNTTVSGNGPGKVGSSFIGGVLLQNIPVGGPFKFDRVSIKDNKAPGLTCDMTVQGVGVLASGNSTIDVDPTCQVSACGAMSSTCGAP